MRTIKYISKETGKEQKVKLPSFNYVGPYLQSVKGSNAGMDARMLDHGFIRKNRKVGHRKSNRQLAARKEAAKEVDKNRA